MHLYYKEWQAIAIVPVKSVQACDLTEYKYND